MVYNQKLTNANIKKDYLIGEKGIFILESRYENPRFCIHAKQIVIDQLHGNHRL